MLVAFLWKMARSRGLDWGLVWAAISLASLTILRPRWLDRLDEPGFVLGIAVVALVALATGRLFAARENIEPAWIFLLSLGGAWATVPDTESISLLLGATLPLAAAATPFRLTTNSRSGGFAVGLLAALVILSDGAARTGSIVGAGGAMALAALPGEGRLRLARHVLLVAFWARVAGRSSSGLVALAWGIGFTALLLLAEWIWRRFRPVP